MSMSRTSLGGRAALATVTALLVSLLAGCAGMGGTAPVKDVAANGDKYLADNFSVAQLSPAVRAAMLPADAASTPARFRTAHVVYRISSEEEGRVQDIRAVFDYRGQPGGLVAVRSEISKNDVPYRQNFALTFGGVLSLRSQTVFLDRSNALLPYEMKEVRRFDRGLGTPAAGQDYAFEGTEGTTLQVMNYLPVRWVCSAGKAFPASTISPAFSGDAVPIDCAIYGADQLVKSHDRMTWLADYGLALQHETANARVHSTFTVQDARIER